MKYTIDSRIVEPGDIFIPLKGDNFDGHDFTDEVIAKGAQVLDVDLAEFAAEHRLKFNIPIIAITGSSGKTTVKDLLAHFLATKFNVVKNSENQNNEIGVPLTLLKINDQTDITVIEFGARKIGDIAYLSKLVKPTAVYITNIGEAHLEIFGSLENIVKAKTEIITKSCSLFVNNQQPHFQEILNRAKELDVAVFEFTEKDILQRNYAAATTIAKHFGISETQINNSLLDFKTSAHRFQVLKTELPDQLLIDDCYNSNPAALRYAIALLERDYPTHKKLFVIGDMLELGDQSQQIHKMLEIAKNVILFTHGEYSRHIQGGLEHRHFEDKQAMLSAIKSLQSSVDLIFVKGSRGMALEEIVDELKVGK